MGLTGAPVRPTGAGMKSKSANALVPPWMQGLARRIRTLWFLKMVGTTLGISGFFVSISG